MAYTFPPKPDTADGFNKPVSWLVGRDLIAGLKWFALFAAFKGKLDPRDWMAGNKYPEFNETDRKREAERTLEFWRGANTRHWNWKVSNDKYWADLKQLRPELWQEHEANAQKEFWFDFIADSGDGQMGVYGVAYLCLSDLWAEQSTAGAKVSFEEKPNSELLPRGQFLFVGGDTAYHIADYTTLHTRFQLPFRWAFTSKRKWLKSQKRLLNPLLDAEGHIADPKRDLSDSEPTRPIFGIPGNHDYYDVVDGFNRQFREPAVKEHARERIRPQLSLPGFKRRQSASYVALQLPFGWWFWGLDTEVSKLDVRQQLFFLNLTESRAPDKLILATPEPTTVFRERKHDKDKTLEAFEQLGLKQPYDVAADEPPGRCRIDLSGDVHHYARYYGPNEKNLPPTPLRSSEHYASVVSGGGGAFMHPSQTRITGDDAVEEQVLYPPAKVSQTIFAEPLFDLRNIYGGGYVWLFGMVLTGIIYFALTVSETSKNFLEWLLTGCGDCFVRTVFGYQIPFTKDTRFPGLPDPHFTQGISLKGFIPATLLIMAALVVLGWAIYLFSQYIKRLTNTPVIFDEDLTDNDTSRERMELTGTYVESKDEPKPVLQKPERLPTTYKDLWPVWLCCLIALLFCALADLKFVANAEVLHPFGSSLLVLCHLVLAAEFVVLSTQNSAWLANRPKFEAGTKYRYIPVWILTVVAISCTLFGIWIFGSAPGAYLLSDTIFALVVVGLFIALTVLGAVKGGELQPWPGKLFMGVMGLWHAILQLAVPLLLVRIGDWRSVVGALILILIFSGLSIPKTKISISGVGARLAKLSEPWNRVMLVVFWIIYGGLLLALPLLFHRRSILHAGSGIYSSFLPQSALGYLNQEWYSVVALMGFSLAVALMFGFLLSMSFLSWYFGVSLAFHGHNNECGGAGRIEKYRHIVRLRVTENDVTAYVIAFDEPAVEGHRLKLNLVDVFTLKVT
jgi:hypothetical protein